VQGRDRVGELALVEAEAVDEDDKHGVMGCEAGMSVTRAGV